jgi:hypothetical protein
MVRNGTRMLEPVGLRILGGTITRDMNFWSQIYVTIGKFNGSDRITLDMKRIPSKLSNGSWPPLDTSEETRISVPLLFMKSTLDGLGSCKIEEQESVARKGV